MSIQISNLIISRVAFKDDKEALKEYVSKAGIIYN
ncbi:MAG: hypothetical protein PWP38_2819 [Clostridiales bacterium]|jgi:hypothetical protein|nr:hypothetical protein [Clostridiales bacterium]